MEKTLNDEKNLPQRILLMIFEEYPGGITAGEIRDILDSVQDIVDQIPLMISES